MELRQILEILLRRKWIILNTFLAILLTIVIGTLLIQPWYDATAKIFLQRSTASSTLLSGLGMQGVSSTSASLSYSDTDRADYLALAVVSPVVDQVIENEHLTRERTRAMLMRKLPFLKPIFRLFGVNVEDTVQVIKAEDLIKRSLISYIFPRPYVNVDQYESTDIITFEAIAIDPQQASSIANAMANAFVKNEVKRVSQDFKGAKEYLQNNIKTYRNEYLQALRALKEFRKREKTVSFDLEVSEAIKEISDLKYSQRDLYLVLAETKTKFSPNHPAVIDIQNKIEQTKKMIQQKIETIFGPEKVTADPALRDLASKAVNEDGLTAHKTEDSASSRDIIILDDKTLMNLPEKSYEYAQLSLAVSVTQDLYNLLLKYNYQVGIAESVALANIYIVETAKTPEIDDSKHKNPRVGLNALIAVILGMVFGVGAGLLVEYMDNTIKTADDLKSDKAVTFLGRIAKLRKKEPRLIDEMDPRSPLREIFRTIRNNIRFATLDNPVKILLVTSSIQGEGRSFIVSNIAISSVNEGKRVLIIDGDMRRPSMHTLFGLDNATGLTSYLVGDASLESIFRQTRIDGLSVITTGPVPLDPAKLVESRKMHQLLEDMKTAYDLVILDSPPVFAAADALILGSASDGAILVVESGRTTRQLYLDTEEALQKANVNTVGVVLNKVAGREGSHSYYYKYYRT